MTRICRWNAHRRSFRRSCRRPWQATSLVCLVFSLAAGAVVQGRAQPPAASDALTVVVMDPLARQLSCDCVKGHAQRNYDLLGLFLERQLDRKVEVVYAEALAEGIRAARPRQVDLIVGKRSLVEADAAACKLAADPLAMLTDQEGSTTLTGLFVVPTSDPARTIADLAGYRIIFGPPDSAEKHSAALAALKKAGVTVPATLETAPACTEAAIAALENEQKPGAAAVISSYAMALLEGCGTVEKGAVRVIGRTGPVPFITVFATPSVAAEARQEIFAALSAAAEVPKLLAAMETKLGFVAIKPKPAAAPKAADSSAGGWPQWRGTDRNAVSSWLPRKLPDRPKILWKKAMTGAGLSGIVAAGRYVVVADRDPMDQCDVFRCLDAVDGQQLWQLQYPAPGDLDYGNSPRATPVIHDGMVYLLGAFGDLHCVKLADGRIVWQTNLMQQFEAKLVTWGMCASPLLVDDKLIVNPGAKEASLVALDRLTGKVVWRSAGMPAAYSSFIVGRFGGQRQIVGYDAISLGGWDVATGRRLWSLIPPEGGDFNVPTPIDAGGKLLVTSENNGTRLYDFERQGKIIPKPVALYKDLAADSSTPLVVDGKVFGCWRQLACLDLNSGLRPLWTAEDEVFEDYVTLIGGPDRILITSARGELLLVGTTGERYELISRLPVFDKNCEVLSHPALGGKRLYIRDASTICCIALE